MINIYILLSFILYFIVFVSGLTLESISKIPSLCSTSNDCNVFSSWSYSYFSYFLSGKLEQDPKELFFSELDHDSFELKRTSWAPLLSQIGAGVPIKIFGDSKFIYILTDNCLLFKNDISTPSKLPTEKKVVLENWKCYDAQLVNSFAYILAKNADETDSKLVRIQAQDFSLSSFVEFDFGDAFRSWSSLAATDNSLYISSYFHNDKSTVNQIKIPGFDATQELPFTGLFHFVNGISIEKSDSSLIYAITIDKTINSTVNFYAFNFTDSTIKAERLAEISGDHAKVFNLFSFKQSENNLTSIVSSIDNQLIQIDITLSPNGLDISHKSILVNDSTSIIHLSNKGNHLFAVGVSKDSDFNAYVYTVLPPLPKKGFNLPPWIVMIVLSLIILIEYIVIIIYCTATEFKDRFKTVASHDSIDD